MSYELYQKRLNRYSSDPRERLEMGRRKNFEGWLKSSPHYLTFEYKDKVVECVFEPFKQDNKETMMHVCCRYNETFEPGDIVTIDGERYMFFYWDQRKNSGYNRWTVVKMTRIFTWTAADGSEQTTEAYMYFQEDNMLKNELKSRSRAATLYLENLKLNFLLMPTNPKMIIGTYLEIETSGIWQQFVVTGFDLVSTPGITFISMDPTYKYDRTPAPTMQPGEDERDFFWLTGGDSNG